MTDVTHAPGQSAYRPTHAAGLSIPREQLHRLWRELVDRPFPEGVAGTVVAGVDLAELDRDAGRLIARVLEADQRPRRSTDALATLEDTAALGLCYGQMARATSALEDGDARTYIQALERVTRHVLEALSWQREPAILRA